METVVESLPFHPPLDWAGLLEFFKPRAILGVEAVSGMILRRSLRAGGTSGTISVVLKPDSSHLEISIFGNSEFVVQRNQIVLLARRVLDLDRDPTIAATCLGADPKLGPLLKRWPGVRLPGAWDGFEMGIRAILGQQISVKAAHTLAGRVADRFGVEHVSPYPDVRKLFPSAEAISKIPLEELAAVGLTQKRAETVHHFSRWWIEAEKDRSPLIDLPGIGPWTDNYIRMRGQSDANAFPAADLGIHKAMGIRDLGPAKAARAAEQHSLAWSPWRAYAVILLWRSLSLPSEEEIA